MAATTNVKVPILLESQQLSKANWFDWKGKVITITKIQGLCAHLTGTLTRPPPASPGMDPGDIALIMAEQELWDKHDEFTKAIITLNIIDLIGTGVEEDGMTTHQMWMALVQIVMFKARLSSPSRAKLSPAELPKAKPKPSKTSGPHAYLA